MMEATLIELVKKFPYLYDKADRNFKNNLAKERAWKNIGQLLDQNHTVIEGRWRVLRNKYNTIRRILKEGGQQHVRNWEHYEAMSFFDSYIQHRNSYKKRRSKSNEQNTPEQFHENAVKIEPSDESEIELGNSEIIFNDPLCISENVVVQCKESVVEKQSENLNLNDEEELFAKQIIVELRKVPNLKDKMYIKREIYNVFYEYFTHKNF